MPFSQALRNLEQMKESKMYYVCGHCGYTTGVRLAFCPVCRRQQGPQPQSTGR